MPAWMRSDLSHIEMRIADSGIFWLGQTNNHLAKPYQPSLASWRWVLNIPVPLTFSSENVKSRLKSDLNDFQSLCNCLKNKNFTLSSLKPLLSGESLPFSLHLFAPVCLQAMGEVVLPMAVCHIHNIRYAHPPPTRDISHRLLWREDKWVTEGRGRDHISVAKSTKKEGEGREEEAGQWRTP